MLYVPILKCKQGEKDALFTLSDSIKEKVLPLLEITSDVIAKDGFNGADEFWEGREFIFDVSPEYRDQLSDDEYFSLLNRCDKELVIPSISLEDSKDKISKLIDDNVNGVAIRLYISEILDDNFESDFKDISGNLDYSNTDLIIDAQFVDPSKLNEIVFLINGAVGLIADIQKFRRVILSCNSFPKSLDIEKYKLELIPRLESKVFNRSIKAFSQKGVKLIYSDYAVNHWSFFEFIPGMQPSFNIRYTVDDYYVCYKGDTVKRGGLNIDKVIEGCNKLISSAYYKGQSFSWGDNEIFEKAMGVTTKPGSLTTWRAIGTSHHIRFMVDHLSNQL